MTLMELFGPTKILIYSLTLVSIDAQYKAEGDGLENAKDLQTGIIRVLKDRSDCML